MGGITPEQAYDRQLRRLAMVAEQGCDRQTRPADAEAIALADAAKRRRRWAERIKKSRERRPVDARAPAFGHPGAISERGFAYGSPARAGLKGDIH